MKNRGRLAALACAAAMACSTGAPDDDMQIVTGIGGDGGGGGTTGGEVGTSEDDGTTTAPLDDDDDEGDVSGGGPILDVGAPMGETGGCDAENDICCLAPGELPPHALLDAFLATYPNAAMPKSVAAIQAFAPMADGHAMAWSDENSGGEIVDPTNGGVVEANIEAGRDLARTAAEQTIPADVLQTDIRDEMIIIEPLDGNGVCLGVGYGWGSVLFEAADGSINEVVYLYIGHCANDGDIEVFYYSDQAAQICEPPA